MTTNEYLTLSLTDNSKHLQHLIEVYNKPHDSDTHEFITKSIVLTIQDQIDLLEALCKCGNFFATTLNESTNPDIEHTKQYLKQSAQLKQILNPGNAIK